MLFSQEGIDYFEIDKTCQFSVGVQYPLKLRVTFLQYLLKTLHFGGFLQTAQAIPWSISKQTNKQTKNCDVLSFV